MARMTSCQHQHQRYIVTHTGTLGWSTNARLVQQSVRGGQRTAALMSGEDVIYDRLSFLIAQMWLCHILISSIPPPDHPDFAGLPLVADIPAPVQTKKQNTSLIDRLIKRQVLSLQGGFGSKSLNRHEESITC